jgi:hypothetical protein
MSLQQLIEQANKLKPKGKRGHVAEKIATYKSKKRRKLARAGLRNGQESSKNNATVVKIPKVIRTLLDSINDDDVNQVALVWREAMKATNERWIDQGKDANGRALGYVSETPDHKTRIAAANMVAAYKEGLPVQRQIRLDAHFDELSEDVAALKRSPAALAFLEALGFQKSGGEKLVENAREIQNENEVHESNDS